MAASVLLAKNRKPSDEEIDTAITNICRCGAYPQIRRAIHRAADAMRGVGTLAAEDDGEENSETSATLPPQQP